MKKIFFIITFILVLGELVIACSRQESPVGKEEPFLVLNNRPQSPQAPQKGITFQLEELSKPERHLEMQSSSDVYEYLVNMYQTNDTNSNIVAKSRLPDSIVNFGYHSFFDGMYFAFMEHRPIVLSPDMIWLLS